MTAEGKSLAGRGSKEPRNRGELQYSTGVSDMSPPVRGRRVLWVGFHALKSVMLIVLIFFICAIPEVLLR